MFFKCPHGTVIMGCWPNYEMADNISHRQEHKSNVLLFSRPDGDVQLPPEKYAFASMFIL